jgi:predicted metal-dependent enzyme (double-stranded beta helix superfamily)
MLHLRARDFAPLSRRHPMFDLERFIDDCEAAVAETADHTAVREVVARVVRDPGAVLAHLGEPTRAGIGVLHRSSRVTILNFTWGPHMSFMPHDHHMWAVIGLYTGREDNIFWRRLPDERSRLEAAGARSVGPGECCPLGADIIHSVLNPLPRLTAAIHVYGGDLLKQARSEGDPETLTEREYDAAKARRMFEESNRSLAS